MSEKRWRTVMVCILCDMPNWHWKPSEYQTCQRCFKSHEFFDTPVDAKEWSWWRGTHRTDNEDKKRLEFEKMLHTRTSPTNSEENSV